VTEPATEPAASPLAASSDARLRAAERAIDKVHVLVLCACAVAWLVVFAHYVLK
jgi:hypothetical protein